MQAILSPVQERMLKDAIEATLQQRTAQEWRETWGDAERKQLAECVQAQMSMGASLWSAARACGLDCAPLGPEPCALLDFSIEKLLTLLRTQSISDVEVIETWTDEGEACATVRFTTDDGQRFCTRLWWIGSVGVSAFRYADASQKAQTVALDILHERVHSAILEKFRDIEDALVETEDALTEARRGA